MYYVYILKCNDNTYYTGSTNDLEKRLKAHNSKKGSKYTRVRLPVEYVFTRQVEDKSAALKLEAKIKKLNRKQKQKIIDTKTICF